MDPYQVVHCKTASGNTYGTFIDAQSLELETYLTKLAEMGEVIHALDGMYASGNGLQSSRRLREWVVNYNALRAEESRSSFPTAALVSVDSDHVAFEHQGDVDWTAFDFNIDATEYGLSDTNTPGAIFR